MRLCLLHPEREKLFHEVVDLSPIVRVGGMKSVMVDDEHGLGAPLGPTALAHLRVDCSAEFTRLGWSGQALAFQTAAHTNYHSGFGQGSSAMGEVTEPSPIPDPIP